GFPESHAASFALLVYVSAWLKCYYPAAFAAALINSQPMGFYAPAQLVADAQKHGVKALPVDVNFSAWDCTLEASGLQIADCGLQIEKPNANPQSQRALRLGLRLVRGLSQAHAEQIVAARGDGAFSSFEDFAQRTGLRSAVLKKLAQAGAFQSLGLTRRLALWRSLPERETMPLFDGVGPPVAYAPGSPSPRVVPLPDGRGSDGFEEAQVSLPEMTPLQEVVADYGTAGLSLRDHPVRFLRQQLDELGVARATDLATLPPGRHVQVAGIVLLRQRPSTAKGITFVTLEDETGMANLIVRQQVWDRYRRVAYTAHALLAHGFLQREAGVIHVLVTKLEDLSARLAELQARSRDFR
ncbi:MAG: hypothetical protein L0Y70_24620, partial [Gemmataceae bacterium]|nr:hypothetical protein [Gemmataceae bacterium]